ncbi:putative RND superfamily exporter [Desulfosarcina cetonica]|uniref:efflux RND transporter permease subunit n=1 Tax=Desulfosarcina cetonica TaxID=90730 RepID=UPI0006D24B81|nr:MMPL family transporter [Desulfosarcina cetonica]VTR65445.1 putative RND superfamily exporter [Desulfosarcina cetonica]
MTTIHRRLEDLFSALAAWVYAHCYITLVAVLLITTLLGSQLPKLTIDTREESFFHEDDPTLIAYNDFRDQFGQDDMFFIALKPENGLSPAFFKTMARLHTQLETSVPYLDEVTSLINGRVVRAEGDTLIVEDLIPRPPQSMADYRRILNRIDRYPLYENLLVSPDRSLAMILVKAQAVMPAAGEDILDGFSQETETKTQPTRRYLSNDQNVEIDTVIRGIVDNYRGKGIDFYFAGNPVFVAELQRGLEKDLNRMIPLSFLLIIIFLAVLFRRVSGVIYPLTIVLLSLVACLGIMAIWRIPITNAIMILPTFLIVVGVGDSVHILTIFYRQLRITGNKQAAIVNAVAYAGLPVLMTSLTTACGLLSFVWADVAIIAQLGYVAPVGVMLALFYTLFLLPALIAIFPLKTPRPIPEGKRAIADRLFDAIARTTTHRPLAVTTIWAVVVLLAGVAAGTVRFSHNAMTWLPEDSTVRIGTQLMDSKNGGTVMLEVLVDSGRENGLHDPNLISRMAQAGEAIPTLNAHQINAAKVVSVADVLKETHRALNQDSDAAYMVPDNRQLVAQELILFESSGSDDLAELTDSSYRTGRLSILAPFTDSILYKDYVDKIKTYLNRQFPRETVTLTGHMALFIGITKMFITSMAKSYLFAFLIITLLMVVMIGRLRVGLMSMIANIVPIILIFGIMGIAGIPIDLMTVLIGSIVLGLVVDDTIHFLHHFRRSYETCGCVETAVRETLFNTGRALVITSLVLCGGFIIYTSAYLSCYVYFGVLVGCAVLFALAADLLLVPALLALLYAPKRMVDEYYQEDQGLMENSN